MIMTLTSLIGSKPVSIPKATYSSKTHDKSRKDNQGNLSAEERARLKEAKIPDWKKKSPEANESKSKLVEGRKYYWCTKCRNGKGMWAMHEKHDDSFQPNRSGTQGILKDSTAATPAAEGKRKVTFTSVEQNDDSKSTPELKVKDELLNNAKSFLAQFSDFQ